MSENDSMSIPFATRDLNSSYKQILINLRGGNHRLDKLNYSDVTGFTVIAIVINEQENIFKFYDGYGGRLGKKPNKISK